MNTKLLTTLYIIILFWPSALLAAQCSATFADGATSNHVDGSIIFKERSQISGNPDGILASPNVDSSRNSTSCWPTQCTSGGTAVESVTLSPFVFTATERIEFRENDITGTMGDQGIFLYDKIKMHRNTLLTASSQPSYGINKFEVGENSVVNLPAGDYYIDELKMARDSSINAIGSGTVRLYLNKKLNLGERARINFQGNPSKVFIYAYRDIDLKRDSTINGYIYAQNHVKLKERAIITGSTSAKKVTLERDAIINYNGSDIANTDFNDFCSTTAIPPDNTTLLAEYRFDECSSASNLLDTQGSYDAMAHGIPQPDPNGIIGQALDLSANSVTDWVTLPPGSIDGLGDFTTSVWIRTTVSKDQQEIYQALGSSHSDDELESHLVGSNIVNLTVQNRGINFNSSKSLTDGEWHQIVLMRTDREGCLYVDGQFEECKPRVNSTPLSVTNTAGFVLGQEQDRYGSRFDIRQGFEGQLDELRFYSGNLSSANVSRIYANEKAGLNHDGTTRSAISCERAPVAEYRFDETSWSGGAGEVVDSIGGFSGSAIATQPIDGKVCNAADFTATGTSDFITLPNDLLSGRKNFSLSLWAKTGDMTRRSIISGANSGSANELLMWFDSGTVFAPDIHNSEIAKITTSNIADNDWHHLVWTRSNSEICLYRDAVLQECANDTSSTMNIASLILGQEQDNVGGGFDASQAFDGLLDELVVFSAALDSSQISQIYTNQNNGLGYDGSARTCPVAPTPTAVLDMRFDESSWANSNSVLDSSGNNYHGSAINSLPTPGLVCNAADLSSNGDDDYLTVNAAAMNGLTDFTTVIWGKATTTNDSTILSAASGDSGLGANEAVWYFDNNNEFWPTITSSQFDESTKLGTTVAMNDGNWHQLVWTRKASSAQSCFFFDGVSQGCVTHTDGNDTSALQVIAIVLGQDQDSLLGDFDSAQDWQGLLDEFLIFDSVLSQGNINDIRDNILAGNNWDGSSRSCFGIVDHYRIEHDGQALTCQAETVTIKACLDPGCDNLSQEPITMKLNVGGTTVATPTILGSGPVPFNFTNASTEILSISEATTIASQSQVCSLNGASDCRMTFDAAGFLVNLEPGESCQTHDLIIQAVKQSDTGTNCAPLYTGNQTVDLSFNYALPSTGVTIPSVDNAPLAIAGSTQSRTLSFGPNAEVTVPMVYNDAGSISITVNGVGSGPLAGLTLTGTDSALYHPHHLAISASRTETNDDITVLNSATSITSAENPTHIAGADFDFNISAHCNNNTNTVTPNYQPMANDRIEISALRTAPLGGATVDGGLKLNLADVLLDSNMTSIALSGSSFADGIAKVSGNYSEVGLIQLTARDKDYYGEGVNRVIASSTINVGRFIPRQFNLKTIQPPILTGHCAAGGSPFVYTGQYDLATGLIGSITYAQQGMVKITPVNQSNTPTINYVGDFNKLNVGGVNWLTPTTDTTQTGNDLARLPLTANMSVGDFGSYIDEGDPNISYPWISQYTYNIDDNFAYNRNANSLIGPFGATIDFTISNVTDADSVTTVAALTQSVGGLNVRYGRWRLRESFGPQDQNLAIPMLIEQYDGNAFVLINDDSCTTFDSNNVTLSTASTTASGDGMFVTSETSGLILQQFNTSGPIEVQYTVPDWFNFDWQGDGSQMNPSATATFGQYRGNDRVIYWREIR